MPGMKLETSEKKFILFFLYEKTLHVADGRKKKMLDEINLYNVFVYINWIAVL